jgi:hypothetical protein
LKIIFRKKNNHLFSTSFSKREGLRCFISFFFFITIHYFSFSQTDSCAFFGDKIIYPYYHPSPASNGRDFYTIKKEFRNVITAQTNFNGIITVIFFINYKGETKYYSTLICDLNYKSLSITNDIELLCSQALQAIKQTSPWKPALDDNKNPINLRKFYSFKFNNGTLIEILPK